MGVVLELQRLEGLRSMDEKALTYQYVFSSRAGVREFTVRLNPDTLELILPERCHHPDWTALGFQKCSNCPLKESDHPRCPTAVGLEGVVETFGSSLSHEEVHVRVISQQRHYERRLPLQKGLSGLMGLLMVTSGCPILSKLRPLVRHHLPFSNLDETQFRILSMYLLAQYLRARCKQPPDWELKGLVKLYQEIETVNIDFSRRLISVVCEDASPNALNILNVFAEGVTQSVDYGMLERLEALFRPYLQD